MKIKKDIRMPAISSGGEGLIDKTPTLYHVLTIELRLRRPALPSLDIYEPGLGTALTAYRLRNGKKRERRRPLM